MARTLIDQPAPLHEVSTQASRSVRVLTFEDKLSADLSWALYQGSIYFEKRGAVQDSLSRIASRLATLDIPYAVVGALAMFRHGYRRFTEDVNLLVTRPGLRRIHSQLKGHGYEPKFTGSKALRDTETGVRIEFVLTGDYPGDGKPKPVVFPDPAAVAVELDGIRYVSLIALIEFKLASGMTDGQRLKDLADVQEMIKTLRLPRNFAENLNPYVRDKFSELWTFPDSEWPDEPSPEHA
jgi:hypothetical protein